MTNKMFWEFGGGGGGQVWKTWVEIGDFYFVNIQQELSFERSFKE